MNTIVFQHLGETQSSVFAENNAYSRRTPSAACGGSSGYEYLISGLTATISAQHMAEAAVSKVVFLHASFIILKRYVPYSELYSATITALVIHEDRTLVVGANVTG